jgi:hypothetical protein
MWYYLGCVAWGVSDRNRADRPSHRAGPHPSLVFLNLCFFELSSLVCPNLSFVLPSSNSISTAAS